MKDRGDKSLRGELAGLGEFKSTYGLYQRGEKAYAEGDEDGSETTRLKDMVINSRYTYEALLYSMREAFDKGFKSDPRAFWKEGILSLKYYDKNPIPEGGEDYPYDEKGGWLSGKEWLQEIEDRMGKADESNGKDRS